MKILSRPKGNAEEYGRWSVNPYIGCSHGCLYCYLKSGPSGGYLGQDRPVLKRGIVSEEHAYHLAMLEIIEHRDEIKRDGGLFMTFTSDPCLPETRELMFRIAAGAIDNGLCLTLLTKNASFYQFATSERILQALPKTHVINAEQKKMMEEGMPFIINFGVMRKDDPKRCVAFGWTLTGHDELEPRADSNERRLHTMRRMSQDGFKTWASIEPVIDFGSSWRMVQQALDAGCQHFKIGLMTKNTKVCRKGFTLGGRQFEPYSLTECWQFVEYVMALTYDRATVYWKQSVEQLLQQSEKDPQPIHGMTAREYLSQWPHSVTKDWSMFSNQ